MSAEVVPNRRVRLRCAPGQRRPSRERALSRALRIAFLVALVPIAAPAQDAAPWIEMTVVGVDPGRVDEFLAAQRELSALDREAGVLWRSVSRTAVFGDTYRFLILSPLANFARYDRDTDADPARAAAIARIRRVVTGRTTYALRTTPGIDNPLPDDAEPSLTLVQVVSVVPGREQDYLRVMAEDVLPHFEDAEMHHTSGALTFGGESGYVHFFHVESFAELDRGSPMARALGASGAQEVLRKLTGAVRRSEQWLVRHLPDASVGRASADEDQSDEDRP